MVYTIFEFDPISGFSLISRISAISPLLYIGFIACLLFAQLMTPIFNKTFCAISAMSSLLIRNFPQSATGLRMKEKVVILKKASKVSN